MTEWITVNAAAVRAGVAWDTMQNWAKEGRVQAKRDGSRWLVHAPSLGAVRGHDGRRSVGGSRIKALAPDEVIPGGDGRGVEPPEPLVRPKAGDTVSVWRWRRYCEGEPDLPGTTKQRVRVHARVLAVYERYALLQFESGVREAFQFRDIEGAAG